MPLHKNLIDGRDVETVDVYPPIPLRQFDWQATFEGDEPNDAGSMAFCGHGRTEADAIADLREQWDERD